MRLLMLALFLLPLAACASPASYAVATPDAAFQGLLAEATVQAVATTQAEAAARASATYAAFVAAQQGTAQAIAAQQTAVAGATLQAVSATQTSVAAASATRQAAAVAAVTGTAVALSTQDVRDGVLTVEAASDSREAAAVALRATEARLSLNAQRDREKPNWAFWWALLGIVAVGLLAGGLLFLLYSYAARLWNESRIIRDGRGDVIAVRMGRVLEYVTEPPAPPVLLPAPAEEETPRVIRVNTPRDPLFQYSDDLLLEGEDGRKFVFSQRQRRRLREWYEAGTTSVRRTTSPAGPGFEQIGISGGDAYQLAYHVLRYHDYVDEANEWTPAGVREFLSGESGEQARLPSGPSVYRPSPGGRANGAGQ